MKRTLICALFPLLALAACRKYSINSEGSSGTNRTRLWDFREAGTASAQPSSAPQQDGIATLYPHRLPSVANCRQRATSPEEIAKMRDAGQMAPVIEATADGSFSDKGKQERALLIARQECAADPAWMTHEIVIIPATGPPVPVVRADMDDDRLLKTFDLSRDGQDELFLQRNSGAKGVHVIQARIYQFDKHSLRRLEDFGDVYENYCGSSLAAQGMSAVVLDYIPRAAAEQLPRFVVQLYRAPCPAAGAAPVWKLVTPSS